MIPRKLPDRINAAGIQVELVALSAADYFAPLLRVFRGGELDPNWELKGGHIFEDATGNQANSLSPFRFEPAVKLRGLLFRKRTGKFLTDEMVEVPITIPGPGKFTLLTNSHVIQGAHISFMAVCGIGESEYLRGRPRSASSQVDPNAIPDVWRRSSHRPQSKPDVFVRDSENRRPPLLGSRPTPQPYRVSSSQPHVAVRINGLTDNQVLYIGEEEESGNRMVHSSADFEGRRKGEMYFFALPSLQPGTTTRLTVIVQTGVPIEFIPPVPKEARSFEF